MPTGKIWTKSKEEFAKIIAECTSFNPNCHSQTTTFCSKNNKLPEHKCLDCDKKIRHKRCFDCYKASTKPKRSRCVKKIEIK